MMPRVIKVEPRDGFIIWVEYDDGVSGEADLSELRGVGVFKAWDEPGCFERVRISETNAIAWDDEIDICPDKIWFDLTGKSPYDVWEGLSSKTAGV